MPVFLAVMLPICALMGFLLATRAMWWTKLTAAAVHTRHDRDIFPRVSDAPDDPIRRRSASPTWQDDMVTLVESPSRR